MSARRLVLITWIDAQSMQSVGRWIDRSDVDSLGIEQCQSVGWVARETPDFITLYSHDGGDVVGGDLCIPRVLISSVQELGVRAVE